MANKAVLRGSHQKQFSDIKDSTPQNNCDRESQHYEMRATPPHQTHEPQIHVLNSINGMKKRGVGEGNEKYSF